MFKKFKPEFQAKFSVLNPTVLANFGKAALCEHPIKGDETTMIAKIDGIFYYTEFWEIPTFEEFNEAILESFFK